MNADTVLLILDYLESNDMSRVVRASRWLRDIAIPVLYLSPRTRGLHRAVNLCQSLCSLNTAPQKSSRPAQTKKIEICSVGAGEVLSVADWQVMEHELDRAIRSSACKTLQCFMLDISIPITGRIAFPMTWGHPIWNSLRMFCPDLSAVELQHTDLGHRSTVSLVTIPRLHRLILRVSFKFNESSLNVLNPLAQPDQPAEDIRFTDVFAQLQLASPHLRHLELSIFEDQQASAGRSDSIFEREWPLLHTLVLNLTRSVTVPDTVGDFLNRHSNIHHLTLLGLSIPLQALPATALPHLTSLKSDSRMAQWILEPTRREIDALALVSRNIDVLVAIMNTLCGEVCDRLRRLEVKLERHNHRSPPLLPIYLKMLGRCFPNVQELVLIVDDTSDIPVQGWRTLHGAFAEFHTLRVLRLSSNGWRIEGDALWGAVSDYAKALPSLQTLDLAVYEQPADGVLVKQIGAVCVRFRLPTIQGAPVAMVKASVSHMMP
ncbi:hypothetical protein BKA62DRAFT_710554 [Auriculariales sp. MPI-PUGE-AT-0066]|nr:hypothetical protein BKA62DRAFT_710554 [Auriculariales sp. MPI-PUGE-AT-0066]